MPTLDEIIIEAAQLAGNGFASTVSASGSALSLLVDTTLLDQAPRDDSFEGAWIYRPNAVAAGDYYRRVASFNTQASGLVPTRAWTNAPGASEVYQVYGLLPPYDQPGMTESYKRLVNRALSNMWQINEFPAGRGGGRIYDLSSAEVTLVAAVAVAPLTTVTTPTGWTLVRADAVSLDVKLYIYTRRSRLTDPTAWTWAFSGTAKASGFVAAVVDCNPTSPIDTSASATVTPAAATVTTQAVTTAQNNELVLAVLAGAGITTYNPPAGSREFIDVIGQDGDAQVGLALVGNMVSNAGGSGTQTVTLSTARTQVATTIALAIRDANRAMTFAGYSIGNNGAGTTSLTITRPLDLPNNDWTPNRIHLRKVVARRYPDPSQVGQNHVDRDLGKRGYFWNVLEDGPNRSLVLSQQTYTTEDVIVTLQRPFPALVSPGDSVQLPLDQVARRTVVELYTYLNSAPATRGQYVAELAMAAQSYFDRYGEVQPPPAVVM